MVSKLKEVVTEVQSAADNVATGAQEMSSTAQQMSQGATEQAASMAENAENPLLRRPHQTAKNHRKDAPLKNPASLRDRVEAFIEGTVSPGGLELLLKECVEDGSSDALVCGRVILSS